MKFINIFYLILAILINLIYISLLFFQIKLKYKKQLIRLLITIIITNIILFSIYYSYYAQIFFSVIFILHLLPFFPNKEKNSFYNFPENYDERKNMFSRNNLKNYPALKEKYYKIYPEHLKFDNKLHKMPEIGSSSNKYYHQYKSKIADANFITTAKTAKNFREDISPTTEKVDFSPEELTKHIIEMAKYSGAIDISINKLDKKYVYSYHGRQAYNWGEEIKLNHKNVILIFVPMNFYDIEKAPNTNVIIASSSAYLEAAKIAYLISEYIKLFGYEAKPHIDGNYDLLCTPLAGESGLGTIGKSGLFLHHKFGSLIRISAVTTNIELAYTPQIKKTYHLDNLCRICNNCVLNCPTKSIRQQNNNKYYVRQETCFAYWKTIGTDCAKCIKVCPMTKPDTLLFKCFKFYLSRNLITQKLGLLLNNLFLL